MLPADLEQHQYFIWFKSIFFFSWSQNYLSDMVTSISPLKRVQKCSVGLCVCLCVLYTLCVVVIKISAFSFLFCFVFNMKYLFLKLSLRPLISLVYNKTQFYGFEGFLSFLVLACFLFLLQKPTQLQGLSHPITRDSSCLPSSQIKEKQNECGVVYRFLKQDTFFPCSDLKILGCNLIYLYQITQLCVQNCGSHPKLVRSGKKQAGCENSLYSCRTCLLNGEQIMSKTFDFPGIKELITSQVSPVGSPHSTSMMTSE